MRFSTVVGKASRWSARTFHAGVRAAEIYGAAKGGEMYAKGKQFFRNLSGKVKNYSARFRSAKRKISKYGKDRTSGVRPVKGTLGKLSRKAVKAMKSKRYINQFHHKLEL